MQDILTHIADGVLTLTINRVEKKNSFTPAMYAAMADGLEQARNDPAICVTVIQGDITVFSAGNDIGDFCSANPRRKSRRCSCSCALSHRTPNPLLQPCVVRRWALEPRCWFTAIWSTRATTRRFPCPL